MASNVHLRKMHASYSNLLSENIADLSPLFDYLMHRYRSLFWNKNSDGSNCLNIFLFGCTEIKFLAMNPYEQASRLKIKWSE